MGIIILLNCVEQNQEESRDGRDTEVILKLFFGNKFVTNNTIRIFIFKKNCHQINMMNTAKKQLQYRTKIIIEKMNKLV